MGCGCNKKKEEVKITNTQENFNENNILKNTKEFFHNHVRKNKMIMTIALLILLIVVLYSIVSSNKVDYIRAPRGYIPPGREYWYDA